MKFFTFVLAAAAMITTSASAQVVSGTYDPSTGVVVVGLDGEIGELTLASLAGGQLIPANLSGALEAAQATDTLISFLNLDSLGTGVFDLGAIVALGTDVADLGFAFTSLEDGALTSPVSVNLSVVPEPASLSLLALGGCSLLARRRRA